MNANNLKCLAPKYFNNISVNEYDVTRISRNTGHYWYYKNRASHPYHYDRANTLRQAVRSIRGIASGS